VAEYLQVVRVVVEEEVRVLKMLQKTRTKNKIDSQRSVSETTSKKKKQITKKRKNKNKHTYLPRPEAKRYLRLPLMVEEVVVLVTVEVPTEAAKFLMLPLVPATLRSHHRRLLTLYFLELHLAFVPVESHHYHQSLT